LAQRIHQVTNGAFVHARHATQFEVSAEYRQCCRQGSNGRARIAHEQAGLALRYLTGQAVDGDRAAVFDQAATQCLQRVKHDPRIVGVQQLMHCGLATAQRRQQQDAVGDAF